MSDLTLREDVAEAHTNVQAIIDVAREHATPVVNDPTRPERQVFVLGHGAHMEIVEPDDSFLEQPRRLKGVVTVEDVPSFTAYVKEFYDAQATTAWVNGAQHRIVAVLNDAEGGPDGQAWRDHRATLQLVKTTEWQRWRGKNGVLMSQEDFARHIEVSELDVVTPDAAELLEIASTFYASTKSEFRSGQRLQSGEVQFEWVSETETAAGRNKDLSVPAKFELAIAPFYGEDPSAVTALLRYRVRDGKLTIGYELVRPDDVERDAMDLIAESLRLEIARVYVGTPSAPA